jgi:hypothetical protein
LLLFMILNCCITVEARRDSELNDGKKFQTCPDFYILINTILGCKFVPNLELLNIKFSSYWRDGLEATLERQEVMLRRIVHDIPPEYWWFCSGANLCSFQNLDMCWISASLSAAATNTLNRLGEQNVFWILLLSPLAQSQ